MSKRRTAVMTSIVAAMLVSSMDTTITNTTMPIVANELGGGKELYAWTFTAYMIFSTVMSPLAGRISDLYGRKRIFGLGILLFLFGSLLCGTANTMLQLVLFRAVQGVGAGIMNPFPMIIAGDLFSVEKRGRIQALFTGMWGLSALLAPLLGSLFVEYASWRWIFYVNIPICLVSFVLLRSYEEVYQSKKAKIDVVGSMLFAAGISLLLIATSDVSRPLLYALSGLAVLVGFVLYERREPSPFIPLSLLVNRPVRLMILNAFVICAALFGTSSYIPLYMMEHGYSPLASGVILLSVSAGWMVTAVPAGKWVLRYGYPPLIIIGNTILLLSAVLLAILDASSSYVYVFLALLVQGVGFGLVFTVGTIGAQQLVEPHQKGISSALILFSRNIGAAVSVTVMGSLLFSTSSIETGMKHMFLYALAVSVLALLTAFTMRLRAAADGQPSS